MIQEFRLTCTIRNKIQRPPITPTLMSVNILHMVVLVVFDVSKKFLMQAACAVDCRVIDMMMKVRVMLKKEMTRLVLNVTYFWNKPGFSCMV